MFNRFRDGLVYPRRVVDYRKDKIIIPLFYVFLFAIVMATASIINVVKYEGLSETYKTYVKDNHKEITSTCSLVDYTLTCDQDTDLLLYEDRYIFIYANNSDTIDPTFYDGFKYHIVINEDNYDLYFMGSSIVNGKLSDLSSDLKNLDIDGSDEYFNAAFGIVSNKLVESRLYWGSALIIIQIVLNFLLYMIFVFVNTIFLRRRFPVVPFKESFVMSAYSATMLFIILAFNNIINLNIFIIVVLIFMAFKQTNMLNVEIASRLKNK
ncbi:hypothetical protein CI105_01980 [Candidatus Izimaplasma bacterium ZiA1]|uniref:DUF1189 family protein n=1 Tax=Candidatus Izimoplasma sp. ZiA1 TaxID=2024899 RepID=UPI000BAA760D|nr:hypothetical protein CI105_01980 [Candidatus Izimaplasma bacterium ZiA1]